MYYIHLAEGLIGFGATPRRVLPMSHFCKQPKWLLPMSNLQWVSGKYAAFVYKKNKLEQELQSSLKAHLSQRDVAAPTFSSRWLCVCPVVCRGKSVYALWHCHLCGRLELTSPTLVSSLRDALHFRTVSIPKIK